MENSNRTQKAHVKEAAQDLLNEGKKWVSEVRDEGMSKVNEVEDNIREYSDQLLRKVQRNPLSAVLIAGGVGFILSKIMGK